MFSTPWRALTSIASRDASVPWVPAGGALAPSHPGFFGRRRTDIEAGASKVAPHLRAYALSGGLHASLRRTLLAGVAQPGEDPTLTR
jgi:hypothetical protein